MVLHCLVDNVKASQTDSLWFGSCLTMTVTYSANIYFNHFVNKDQVPSIVLGTLHLFSPHNVPYSVVIVSFYKWVYWFWERLSHIPKNTQIVWVGKAGCQSSFHGSALTVPHYCPSTMVEDHSQSQSCPWEQRNPYPLQGGRETTPAPAWEERMATAGAAVQAGSAWPSQSRQLLLSSWVLGV